MDSGTVRQESFQDANLSLSEIADRASEYSINLDDRVDRGDTPILQEGPTIVYRSNLHPGGMIVATRTLRNKLRGGEKKIAVGSLWTFVCESRSDPWTACPPRNKITNSATSPKLCPPISWYHHQICRNLVYHVSVDGEKCT